MSGRLFFNCIVTTACSCALFLAAVPFTVLASSDPLSVQTVEHADLQDNPAAPSVSDMVSLNLPVVYDNDASQFDFHLDPYGLIYMTSAARYGGGLVEEGATLLFRNTEGVYTFSSRSDCISLSNHGDVSVTIDVHAQIDRLNQIELTESPFFEDPSLVAIYLAIADDDGYETPLSKDRELAYSFELPAGESYSFGLTGACNADADWAAVYECPVVTITWNVAVKERKEDDADRESSATDRTPESDELPVSDVVEPELTEETPEDDQPDFYLYQETLPTEPVLPEPEEPSGTDRADDPVGDSVDVPLVDPTDDPLDDPADDPAETQEDKPAENEVDDLGEEDPSEQSVP